MKIASFRRGSLFYVVEHREKFGELKYCVLLCVVRQWMELNQNKS